MLLWMFISTVERNFAFLLLPCKIEILLLREKNHFIFVTFFFLSKRCCTKQIKGRLRKIRKNFLCDMESKNHFSGLDDNRYCDLLGVSYGPNLDYCNQRNFAAANAMEPSLASSK